MGRTNNLNVRGVYSSSYKDGEREREMMKIQYSKKVFLCQFIFIYSNSGVAMEQCRGVIVYGSDILA